MGDTQACDAYWHGHCHAFWNDELTDDIIKHGCDYEAEHVGPHRNKRAGVTWGGPTHWFGDAA